MEELVKLIDEPFIVEKSTTEAFVCIVADFCEHFETQREIFDSMAIVNGIILRRKLIVQDLLLSTLPELLLWQTWPRKSKPDLRKVCRELFLPI